MSQVNSILIVDDEPDVRVLVHDTLKNSFSTSEIRSVASREEVERALNNPTFDVIITDYWMSGFTGLDVVEWVNDKGLDIPVIMLTGSGNEEIAIKAMRTGVADYVVKTAGHIRRLPATIDNVLERWRLARAKRRAEKQVRVSERRYQDLYDDAPDLYFTLGKDGSVQSVNRFGAAYLGYSKDELMHLPFWNVVNREDLELVKEQLADIFRRGIESGMLEFRQVRKDGSKIWVQVRTRLTYDKSNGQPELRIICRDVTAQKSLEEQLKFDAFHDALTGLPNRALFQDRVQHALRGALRREDYQFAVLFLDLDRFKLINDSMGHAAGDELLVTLAGRMQKYLRTGDSIARLGGDEFAVLLDDLRDIGDATRFAERIQVEISRPVALEKGTVSTSVSIGIASSSTVYDSPEAILRDADTAMYRAKEQGKAQFVLFDYSMHAEAVRRLSLEHDLRVALDNEQFSVFYQPILSLQTGKLKGFESLLRWDHPSRGLLTPDKFLNTLDDIGMMAPVSDWMMQQICQQGRQWRDQFAFQTPPEMSFNLSGSQLSARGLEESIVKALEGKACPLRLEVGEDAVTANAESLAELLQRLESLSVQLSIDNFGSGYSSFSWLHRLPVGNIKIGRSFISNAEPGNESMKILATILGLGKQLGVDVTAVGVRDKQQMDTLKSIDCSNVQGNYIAQAMDHAQIESLLDSRPQWLN